MIIYDIDAGDISNTNRNMYVLEPITIQNEMVSIIDLKQ